MKKKRAYSSFILLSIILVVTLSTGFASAVSAKTDDRVSVIVGLKGNNDVSSITSHYGQVEQSFSNINAVAVTIPSSEIDSLKADPNVAYVENDATVHALAQPVQWGVTKIGAPTVWAGGNKGTGIKVAVLDTGIDTSHSDLRVVGGASFVASSGSTGGLINYNDDNGHGTHCAGIIAALDNNIGVVGVAPEASLYAVKVLDYTGSGYYSSIISGIEWCITNNIQVISMSFGGSSDSIALHAECDKAYNAGIVLVASAGNSGPGAETMGYPAKYSSVISVAATDSNDVVAIWSSRGTGLSVSAPGVSIYSTYYRNRYATMSGTSMACPHAVGTVALILKNSARTPAQVKTALQNTAVDLGVPGYDTTYGYGRINAAAAVGDSAPSTPDFSISPTSNNVDITRGSSGTSAVTVTSVNTFSGTVSLTTSTPAGWTATPNPASLPLTSGASAPSTVTINVPSTASAGLYTVTITGTSGSLSHQATVTVNVQNPITAPSAPQTLRATAGNAQVSLSWTAPASNGGASITNYKVYRGSASGSESLLTTLGNVLSYVDNAVSNGQNYFYLVTAVNSAGESPVSNEVNATPTASQTKLMNVAVKADLYVSSMRVVVVTVTVKDSGTGAALKGAIVSVTIYNPDNTVVGTFAGRTDSTGTLRFSYMGQFSQTGTYTVTSTVTLTGYPSGTGTTTFQVT